MADRDLSPEEEYFAKEDLEKLKRIREERDKTRAEQAVEQRRQAHWMKCPKCGGDMKEQVHREVAIDICQECGGVYLDNGELELLLEAKDSVVGRILQSFRDTMSFGGGIRDGAGDLPKK